MLPDAPIFTADGQRGNERPLNLTKPLNSHSEALRSQRSGCKEASFQLVNANTAVSTLTAASL